MFLRLPGCWLETINLSECPVILKPACILLTLESGIYWLIELLAHTGIQKICFQIELKLVSGFWNLNEVSSI